MVVVHTESEFAPSAQTDNEAFRSFEKVTLQYEH